MNLITFGLGGSAADVLLGGFAPAPAAANTGSYVTLGYGESAANVVTLGLHPGALSAPGGGSFITFGLGQTSAKVLMFGLAPAPAPPDFVGGYAAAAWSGDIAVPAPRKRTKRRTYDELTDEERAAIDDDDLFLLGIFP